jgi:hypothetical protein
MYKPSTYLVVTYFPTYLPVSETYFFQNWLPTEHPVDGAMVGAGSLWAMDSWYMANQPLW